MTPQKNSFRLRDDEHPEGAERERILHGLELGFEAAQRIGDRELAAALERALQRVRRGAEDEGAEREGQEGRRQLEVLRMVRPALAEGEKRDAVDLLDRAIRVREMALEGRHGEELDALRRRAPDRGQLTEILSLAAGLWEKFGHARESRAVAELAALYRGHGRGREPEPRERDERERPDRELIQRLERIEERIESIEGQIEELRGERRRR